MRCIEILYLNVLSLGFKKINRNMRCIEIGYACIVSVANSGLIETWDVLKWFIETGNA